MAADLSAVQAYQAAIRTAQQSAMGSGQDAAASGAGIDFGSLVSTAIADTSQSLGAAEQMTAAGAAGEAELIDVVTAVSAAEISLETVVAVRDEVVKAYQEILRMPI
ncbi:flagellar basal body rod protein [Maricaulis sp. W15]|uniref:Flagellar hook-basal body complex protein FliE n=1 Tax=Maricaulis maris TaxID=74318 RepID=A0A495DCV5_9PROT|nr:MULTISPECIES: flagellar hook-basal body complex protein FliE [Maricaulis]OLF74059.1 flagellar basal body rod protein [Maricaulis sp. W15]RKR00141.1 flagellar hook-basal body complex protein FliE [Maricaulis maris]